MSELMTLVAPPLRNSDLSERIAYLREQEAQRPVFDPDWTSAHVPRDLPGKPESAGTCDIDEAYDQAARMADLAIELAINGDGQPAQYYIGEGTEDTKRIHDMAKFLVSLKLEAYKAQSMALAATNGRGYTTAG